MIPTVSQEKFLSNDRNKNRFIFYLSEKLKAAEFFTDQAYEDADAVIVQTAINVASDEKPAVIVAEDIDILVILTQKTPVNKKVYFLKPSKGKTAERLYDSNAFINASLKNVVGFIHAFAECDTTSAFYKQGKSKIIRLLENNISLLNLALTFNMPNATSQQIEHAGTKLISAMYGGKKIVF